ncbi:hypothetical protein NOV72_05758 [Caballeronia novacaledonica]|uniref:Uncharacterized protein n=1 Tax=Caballeronia novacaledonica TaxID=1544861 RepID=A0A2U3IEB2_9BURK|nr:neuraminidase-like domain-containing protein [Caballeronia novacaledonica]SPB18558.1 hypothetical protein NOV72_05758 [Caballeronia novacaledonica]
MSAQFIVRGTITDQQLHPLAGMVVRAFDKDLPSLRSDELLGVATTNQEGAYEIRFEEARFRAHEAGRADVYIQVLGADGAVLGRSDPLFNPDREVRVDLMVEVAAPKRLSEYEQLLTLIGPLIEPVPLADVTAEDITFLSRDVDAERVRIAWLAAAVNLASQTGVPAPAFYGWARAEQPNPSAWRDVADSQDRSTLDKALQTILKDLATVSRDLLVRALLASISDNIIPAIVRKQLDEIVANAVRASLTAYQVVARLCEEQSGAPLTGRVVRVLDMESPGKPEEIGRETTDAQGLFVIEFRADNANDQEAARRLRLMVPDEAGNDFWSTELRLVANRADILEIRMPAPPKPEREQHTLERLVGTAQIEVPADLLQFLAGRDIRTLGDIRRAGGLREIDGLPVAQDAAAVRTLDAHADLSRISDDVVANSKLIARGFSSVADIARAPMQEFVSAVHDVVGDFPAARMQVAASAQTGFLKHVLTGFSAEQANGFHIAGPDGVDAAVALPEQCGCDDCEAAVSPAAYLADLVGYASTHLKESGAATNFAYLTNTFHQPFGDLPTDCEAVGQLLRQVRLCIESLRAYTAAHPLGAADASKLESATGTYLLSAYELILTRFGTSYEEIRLARSASDDERHALAERLAIDLTEPRPDPVATEGDELDQMFLDPKAALGDPHAMTELALERLFGLVDTTRDVLSDGVKIGDGGAPPVLAHWRFSGFIWSHNTDAEGMLHLTVKNFITSMVESQVEVYRDSARTSLVAAGTAKVLTGDRSVWLSPRNASGLSGAVTVAGTLANNTAISVALVPNLLRWRLRNLRTIWRGQDFIVDIYSPDYLPADDRRPVLEPDVIGPDDFRRPDAASPPFALWRKRRLWVDQRLTDLAAKTKTVVVDGVAMTVPNLDKVLATMFAPIAYDATSITPWLAATPVSEFNALGDVLERGSTTDIVATKERLARDLNVEPDAFALLQRIRAKQRQWEVDPKSEKVQADEWSDTFSLLVNAQKRRFYAAWLAEEQAASLRFGPEDFWRAQREPPAGAWPPLRTVGHPLIDPDELKLTDLPELTVGKESIQLWHLRHDALIAETAAIRTERENNGFDSMLRRALGHPAPGDPLQYDFATIRTDLASSDGAVVAAATSKVVNDLFLTVERFNRVMTMKDQAAPASPRTPTGAEWNDLYALLTTAHKAKHLYPQWVTEEETTGRSAEYWRALKAALPRMRATAEQRSVWEQGLAARSRPSIVDPDLMDTIAFNGLGAEAAFTLWQVRHDWVANTIADLDAKPKTLAGFDSIVEGALATPMADLLALDTSRVAGQAVQWRLDQLSLSNAAFAYLLKIRALLAAGQPVIADEWDGIHSILLQVMKSRLTAQWRDEERLAGVILSPDFFVAPDALPAQPAAAALRWRFDLDTRFNWLDTLQARVDQDHSTLASYQDVLSAVEEIVLPTLRDALIVATGEGADLETKAAWLTDRLLIDAKAGGCQKTTRISQAIETLQILLFSARSGQSTVLQNMKLTLDAPDFDEEWRWIGSYATWRAAMFVTMYPENIAAGNLRRRQTPAFRRLVKSVRDARQLTSEQACSLAAEYATYYEDIARLAIGATAQATVTQRSGSQCVPGAITRKPLVFLFGRGGISNSLYWSTFDPADTSGSAQSFWDTVPGVSTISSVSGIAVYERSPTERHVFVFIRTADYKLQFLTFDLETGNWDGPTDLALPPGDPRSIEVVVDQNGDFWYMPRLALRSGGDGSIYCRDFAPDGSGWQEGDWKIFRLDPSFYDLGGGNALSGVDRLYAMRDGFLIFGKGGRFWETAPMSSPDDSFVLHPYPSSTDKGSFVGALYWGKAKNGWNRYIVIKQADHTMYEDFNTPKLSDGAWSLDGLSVIAPNSGYVDYSSYAYQRRNDFTLIGFKSDVTREQDGVYLRLIRLEEILSDAPIVSTTYRIAPRVLSVGQFLIPSRIEGAEADVRRNMVKFVLTATSDSATNRTYVEEAYYFVPMLLCDGLQRAGEYRAALDMVRTVLDYTSPPGRQKIYYGLVQEESLPEVYKRGTDWLLDPLDPHAIAASRRLTYTRFTLLTIAKLLRDYADDEFTRDTAESVPRARTLYLAELAVLSLPELHQQLGGCDDLVGEIEIPLGPAAPIKASIGIAALTSELRRFRDAGSLAALVPKVKSVIAEDSSWDDKLANARKLVEEATVSQPSPLTIAKLLETHEAASTRAYAGLLTSRIVSEAVEAVGMQASAQLAGTVAAAAGTTPSALETSKAELPWLRRGRPSTAANDVDFVLSPTLDPIAPKDSPSLAGLFRPGPRVVVLAPGLVVPAPAAPTSVPVPLLPSNPVKPTVTPSLAFCVPPNPVLTALRLHAELNLSKIRTCRNIAGMKRELEPYVAPTDTVTGLPTIGANGQLVLSGTNVLRPTIYRYPTLIQRAKDLAGTSQQFESAMLAAIEKGAAEAYTEMKARQDLELAQAGVQLEVLKIKQANDGVTLASLQQQRAQIQLAHYQKLLDEGQLELENEAIDLLRDVASLQSSAAAQSVLAAVAYSTAAGAAAASPAPGSASSAASAIGSAFQALGGDLSSLASSRSTQAQISLTLASFERRKQEWEFSAALARQDVDIGGQQVTLANDTVEIAKQEKVIAETRNTQAKDTVAFLANKFANVELYDWMSEVLEGVYSYFLKQATSIARVAEDQLAFERQEPTAGFIQSDYWQAPVDSMPTDNLQAAPVDRRGLTGSARLLQDIYRLDQYAFDTNKLKLQLSKTVSLALNAPTEFQRFRETGVMTFATPMLMFDRDFPGHYVRLIRRVRVSVVALIPPIDGIHATLSSAGVSRVVTGPDIFQTVPVRRDPEQVALTSPMNASGVFDLDAQSSSMLMPFEGCGVDTNWELRMPKAANFFDYLTLADVLFTIDFTALPSSDYAQQVIQSLRQSTSGDRPFSFRNQFADQWYDLHNPAQTSTPMVVKFRTLLDDFPPNVDALRIQHLALCFARQDGKLFEVAVAGLRFVEEGNVGAVGGAATTIDGIVSTRRGNAGSWISIVGRKPFGEWELSLPDTEEMRGRFATGDIEDILLVVTYSGRTRDWPS